MRIIPANNVVQPKAIQPQTTDTSRIQKEEQATGTKKLQSELNVSRLKFSDLLTETEKALIEDLFSVGSTATDNAKGGTIFSMKGTSNYGKESNSTEPAVRKGSIIDVCA